MARSKRSGGEGGPVAAATGTEFVLYQTDDGLARVQVRLHEGAVWLTQRDLADLYQVRVPTLNEHLRNVYAEGELAPEATIRQYLTVRTEGNRSVSRVVDHYALPVVLAVGSRVRSTQGNHPDIPDTSNRATSHRFSTAEEVRRPSCSRVRYHARHGDRSQGDQRRAGAAA